MRLLALFVGVVAVRLACNLAVPAPYILTDELLYTKLARAFLEGSPLHFRGSPIAFPAFLYPLIISPATALADPLAAFRAIQVLNALLFGLAAIPLYLLALRLLGPALAPWAAGLALLPPYSLQSAVAMSENLFFPLVTWVAYLLVAASDRPAARLRYGLAIAMGLAFLTKPHGMTVLPVAFLARWGLLRLLDRLQRPRGPVLGPLALYAGCVLIAVAVIGSLPGGKGPFDVTRLFGTYSEAFTGRRALDLVAFAESAVANASAIGAAVGFLPLVLFWWYGVRALREGPAADRTLAVWVLAFGGLLIALTARHTVTLDDVARVHERYGFYVEPLILLGAFKQALHAKPHPLSVALAVGLLGLALVFAKRALATPVVADSLTFAAIRPLVEVLGPAPALAGMGIGGAALLILAGRALDQGRQRPAGLLLAGYLASLNGLALVSQHFASMRSVGRIPLARFVTSLIPENRVLAIVSASGQLPDQLMVEYVARNPIRVLYDGLPQHHLNDRPVDRRDGVLLGLTRLPDGAGVLVADSVSLALPLLAATRDLALYEKRGTVRETQTIAGRFADGWTDGRCVISETRYRPEVSRALLRLQVQTYGIPPSLAPYRLTVRDGRGAAQTLEVPIGAARSVEAIVSRAPGQPFVITIASPTWSPAEAYGQADTRRLGILLRGAAFAPLPGRTGRDARVHEAEDQVPGVGRRLDARALRPEPEVRVPWAGDKRPGIR